MRVVTVSDPSDERLRDYTALTDVALRSVREPAEGLFMAESAKVVGRALAAGFAPRSALMSARWLEQSEPILGPYDVDVYVVPDDVLEQVTGFAVHRGMLAAMDRRPLPSVADLVRGVRVVAVLEDLVDHTNVGAVARSAVALGVGALLVSPRCADPLYRRSVRVSMGTVLSLPWTRATPWPDTLEVLRSQGFRLLALTPDPAGTDLGELDVPDRSAVLIGSEGHGLSDAALALCDERVRIPMHGGVDSLNAAAASAVAFWALTRGA